MRFILVFFALSMSVNGEIVEDVKCQVSSCPTRAAHTEILPLCLDHLYRACVAVKYMDKQEQIYIMRAIFNDDNISEDEYTSRIRILRKLEKRFSERKEIHYGENKISKDYASSLFKRNILRR